MARIPCQFQDPAGVVADYNWAINYLTESPMGRKRSESVTAPTNNTGVVRQQGTEAPINRQLSGTILTEAQHSAFIQWWVLCRTQTIYFQDVNGDLAEVLIVDYEAQKNYTAWNTKDPVNAPYHYYTYTLTMDIITQISGSWAQAN